MSDDPLNTQRYINYVNPYWHDVLSKMDLPQTWSTAEKEYLYDSDNRRWIDCVAGFGAVPFGHNHPHFINVLENHLSGRMPSTFPFGANYLSACFAEKIITGIYGGEGKVHFSSSGSEAVETALKMAMSYTQRSRFISCERGYHGLTLHSMQLNGSGIWAQTLPERYSNVSLVRPGDIEAITSLLHTGEYAALILEVSQGVGGGYVWSAEHLRRVNALCQDAGTLLIVDEAQTGWGRSGYMSAYSHLTAGLFPDIILFSKGMTNGMMPLSVTVCTTAIHASLFAPEGCAKIHGSTYSGYTAGLSLGMASFEYILEHDICHRVCMMAKFLRAGFKHCAEQKNIPLLVEGMGLLITLTFSPEMPDLASFCWACYCENTILVNYSAHRENTLVLTPPLIISDESSHFILDVFNAALNAYMDENFSRL